MKTERTIRHKSGAYRAVRYLKVKMAATVSASAGRPPSKKAVEAERRDLMALHELFALRLAEGRDTLGFDKGGFNEWGENISGYNRDGTLTAGRQPYHVRTQKPWDERGYDSDGVWIGVKGNPRAGRANGNKRSPLGWNKDGFSPFDPKTGLCTHALTGTQWGPPPDEMNWRGTYKATGLDRSGYNEEGYNPKTGHRRVTGSG